MSNTIGNCSNDIIKESIVSKSPPPPLIANDSRIRTRFGGSTSHRNYAMGSSASALNNNGLCCNGTRAASDLSETSSTENGGRGQNSQENKTIKSRFYDPWNEFALGLFFDALKLFGKDFDQIHNYFQQKSKQQTAKNYAQIKTFYRRTWLKLSTKLNLPENANIPKDAKEIFSMIAYGELMKRAKNLKMTSPDFSVILSGLVFNGFTVVRIRVKVKPKSAETSKNRASNIGAIKLPKKKIRIVKIKMPQCPALTKFVEKKNAVSENHILTKESTSMPKSVTLELVPKTYGDKAYVLTHCKQNPQIKFNLALNQPISEILVWLKRKWLPEDQRTLLQCQLDQPPDTSGFCWPDITIFPSNDIRLNLVSIYPIASDSSTQSSVTSLYGLKQCFSLISDDDMRDGSKSSTKIDSTLVNSASSMIQSSNLFDEDPAQMCVVQSDGTKLTICPKIIENGLSLENCGGLTVGQLCLSCCRSPVLRFTYTIKSKIQEMDTVSPVWKCFLRLIQHNFFELLNDPRPNSNQTMERHDTTVIAASEASDPQRSVQEILNVSDGFPMPVKIDSHAGMKRKPCKTESNPSMPTAVFSFSNNNEQPIVASETQAFLMQYKKIREEAAMKQKKRYTASSSTIFRAPSIPARRQPSSKIVENFIAPRTPPSTFQKIIAPQYTQSPAVSGATVVNIIPSSSTDGTGLTIIPLESVTQPQTPLLVSAHNMAERQNLIPILHGPFSDIADQQNEVPVTSLIMTENGEISIQSNHVMLTGEEVARDSFDNQRVTPSMQTNVHHSGQSIPLDLHDLSLQSNSSIFGFTLNTPMKKSLLNPESTQMDEIDKPCSTNHLTLDFSLDSLKSGNSLMGLSSSADIHLQDDVKRSMQLMNEQDSIEFCRNFAQLADVLVTPKKTDDCEMNHNYFH